MSDDRPDNLQLMSARKAGVSLGTCSGAAGVLEGAFGAGPSGSERRLQLVACHLQPPARDARLGSGIGMRMDARICARPGATAGAATATASRAPVCLVLGAGAGIGGTAGRRFAAGGYHAVLCRRSDSAGLDKMVAQIEADGGSATGFLVNAIEEGSIEQLVAEVERDIGPIEVAVFNLGAQIGNRDLLDTSYKAFELGWRMATFGLFRLATALCPLMAERQNGTILVTSATAAMRGNAGQHSHAAAMGGRRMLCQTLNAEFASKGIHICHIIVDGAVD
eukprot:SAG31_NODE_8250_length_1489_cov_1.766906_1_plen_278_part_01